MGSYRWIRVNQVKHVWEFNEMLKNWLVVGVRWYFFFADQGAKEEIDYPSLHFPFAAFSFRNDGELVDSCHFKRPSPNLPVSPKIVSFPSHHPDSCPPKKGLFVPVARWSTRLASSAWPLSLREILNKTNLDSNKRMVTGAYQLLFFLTPPKHYQSMPKESGLLTTFHRFWCFHGVDGARTPWRVSLDEKPLLFLKVLKLERYQQALDATNTWNNINS